MRPARADAVHAGDGGAVLPVPRPQGPAEVHAQNREEERRQESGRRRGRVALCFSLLIFTAASKIIMSSIFLKFKLLK